jgi:hypothetical protein
MPLMELTKNINTKLRDLVYIFKNNVDTSGAPNLTLQGQVLSTALRQGFRVSLGRTLHHLNSYPGFQSGKS